MSRGPGRCVPIEGTHDGCGPRDRVLGSGRCVCCWLLRSCGQPKGLPGDDEFSTAPTVNCRVDSYAIISEPLRLHFSGPSGWTPHSVLGDGKLTDTSRDGSPVFLGVADSGSVQFYLRDVEKSSMLLERQGVRSSPVCDSSSSLHPQWHRFPSHLGYACGGSRHPDHHLAVRRSQREDRDHDARPVAGTRSRGQRRCHVPGHQSGRLRDVVHRRRVPSDLPRLADRHNTRPRQSRSSPSEGPRV